MFVAMIVVVSMQLMNYIHILFLIVNLTPFVGIAALWASADFQD